MRAFLLGYIAIVLSQASGSPRGFSSTDLVAGANDTTAGYSSTAYLRKMFDESRDNEHNSTALRLPFANIYGGLTELGAQVPDQLLTSYAKVELIATNFRMPLGLGFEWADTCFVFTEPVSGGIGPEVLFHQANPRTSGRGEEWNWSVPGYEGHPDRTEFVAHGGASSVEVCNSSVLMADSEKHKRLLQLHGNTGNTQLEICRLPRPVNEMIEGLDKGLDKKIDQICITASDSGKIYLTVNSATDDSAWVSDQIKQAFGITISPNSNGGKSLTWELPSSGEFNGTTWLGILFSLGFGIML
jgi:hypothetical protein